MKKRFHTMISLLCMAALLAGMLAGCSSASSSTPAPAPSAAASTSASGGSDASEPAASGPVFENPVTISMLAASHASWPFQDDWYVLDVIKDYTNVDLEVTTVDTSGFN